MVFSAIVPLPVFFSAFATEDDPYAAVKAWAQEIFEARREARWKRGVILIHGRDSSIKLESDMPEMALDSLAEIDWGPGRIYKWDADQNEWGSTRILHAAQVVEMVLRRTRVIVGVAGLWRLATPA